jgi:hypothetical protein
MHNVTRQHDIASVAKPPQTSSNMPNTAQSRKHPSPARQLTLTGAMSKFKKLQSTDSADLDGFSLRRFEEVIIRLINICRSAFFFFNFIPGFE